MYHKKAYAIILALTSICLQGQTKEMHLKKDELIKRLAQADKQLFRVNNIYAHGTAVMSKIEPMHTALVDVKGFVDANSGSKRDYDHQLLVEKIEQVLHSLEFLKRAISFTMSTVFPPYVNREASPEAVDEEQQGARKTQFMEIKTKLKLIRNQLEHHSIAQTDKKYDGKTASLGLIILAARLLEEACDKAVHDMYQEAQKRAKKQKKVMPSGQWVTGKHQ